MKKRKEELHNIIRRDGPIGGENHIKKPQVFLGGNEIPSVQNQEIKHHNQ
ncbi:MAG TPA: hypothetical protein PKI04_10325 [Kaistella sp.]|nr:hypothetical protein [Kaistella sp.]